MNEIHPRIQTNYLKKMLQKHPVVILHGARQTGKTTLCKMPDIGNDREYITMDNLEIFDLAKRDPEVLFIGKNKITMDEVQREPEILFSVKNEVDKNRLPGRFLITGSANLLIMKKISETLAGRGVYFFLPGFIWPEIEKRSFGYILDLLLEHDNLEKLVSKLPGEPVNANRELTDAVFAGGYPPPSLSSDSEFRYQWYDSYILTYIERDLRQFSAIENLTDFRRLMSICAAQNGRVQNIGSMANDAGLTPSTARRYLNLLEASFQIFRVPAFYANRGKRLVKSPRIYWSDTGLCAFISGFFEAVSLSADRVFGLFLENWVCVHLLAYVSFKIPKCSLYYWRTSSGYEVDFILEHGKRLLPVEVKNSSNPGRNHIKSLNIFLDAHPEAPIGIIACRCEKPRVLSRRILALPFEYLLLQ